MIWLAWILVALVCALLFSVIKTLDRVTYAVQLLEARLDRVALGIEDLKAAVNASHARLEAGAPPAGLGSARGAIPSTTRSA